MRPVCVSRTLTVNSRSVSGRQVEPVMTVDGATVEHVEEDLRLLLRGGGEEAGAGSFGQCHPLGAPVPPGRRRPPLYRRLEPAAVEADGARLVAGSCRAVVRPSRPDPGLGDGRAATGRFLVNGHRRAGGAERGAGGLAELDGEASRPAPRRCPS